MTNEQKLLHAAKFALASLKLNGLDKPGELQLTALTLEAAINNYGEEHVREIVDDVAFQNRQKGGLRILLESLSQATA